jgi:hypothetical protein
MRPPSTSVSPGPRNRTYGECTSGRRSPILWSSSSWRRTDYLELTARSSPFLLPQAWRGLGGVRYHRADISSVRDGTPCRSSPPLKRLSIKAMQLSSRPGDLGGSHAHLGMLFSAWASHLGKTSRDPSDLFRKADDHFAAALKAQPQDSWFLRLRATCLVSRAEYRESRGEDPFPDYALAETTFRRASRSGRTSPPPGGASPAPVRPGRRLGKARAEGSRPAGLLRFRERLPADPVPQLPAGAGAGRPPGRRQEEGLRARRVNLIRISLQGRKDRPN